MDKIKFDFDALVTASTRLSEEKDKLKELKTEVDNAMEALRTQGWIGKGEEAFVVFVREQLGIMMEQYADLMKTLSDILKMDVIQEYNDLVEAAQKLEFPL